MAEQLTTEELLKFCMALSPEDCRKLFSENPDRDPIYNARKVGDVLLHKTGDRQDCRAFKANLLGYFAQPITFNRENLLNIIAQHSGAALHAFLEVLKKEDVPFYRHVERKLKERVYRMPCELAVPYTDDDLPSDRTALKDKLNDIERLLLICPSCELVMNNPTLLQCLHSCCQGCMKQVCARCHKDVKHCQPNHYLQLKIATQAELLKNCGNNQESSSSEVAKSVIPKCKLHGDGLAYWCYTCKGYRCAVYASQFCDRPVGKHDSHLARTIASELEPFLEPFTPEDGMSANVLETPIIATQKRLLDHEFGVTRNILQYNKSLLAAAAERAFTQAQDEIKGLHSTQSKVVDGIAEQLKQAYLYVHYIRGEYWHVMDQRKLLLEQLMSLLAWTEKADRNYPSLTPELCQLCGITDTSLAGTSNGLVKSLVVKCLDKDDFTHVTRRLIGQPDLITSDHLVPGDNSQLRHLITDLSMIEEKTRLLHDNQCIRMCGEASAGNGAMKQPKFEEPRMNSNGECCDINRSDEHDEDATMRRILRTHSTTIELALVPENAHAVARFMFYEESFNEIERNAVLDAHGRAAASKLLDCVYKRAAKGVRDFQKALKKAELHDVAKLLEKPYYSQT